MSEEDQSNNGDLAKAIIECLQRGDEYDDLYSFGSGRLINFKQHGYSLVIPHEGEGSPHAVFGGATYYFTVDDWGSVAKTLQQRTFLKPRLSKAELIKKLKTQTSE